MNDNNGIQNVVEVQPTVAFDNQQVSIDVQSNIRKKSKLLFYLLIVVGVLLCVGGGCFVGLKINSNRCVIKEDTSCKQEVKQNTIENNKKIELDVNVESNEEQEKIEEPVSKTAITNCVKQSDNVYEYMDEYEIPDEVELTDSSVIDVVERKVDMLISPIYTNCVSRILKNNLSVIDGNNRTVASRIVEYNYANKNFKQLEAGKCYEYDSTNSSGQIIDADNCSESQLDGRTATYFEKTFIENEYKALTGYDMTIVTDGFGGCPYLHYDPKDNRYYLNWFCGGTCANAGNYYIYKYTHNNNFVYVYVVYNEDDETEITKENYNKYPKYRIYFEKNNSNYYFRKITRVEK